MTATLMESAHTYLVTSGGQSYYYTVVANASGVQGIRDIRSLSGPVCGLSQIPQFVLDAQQVSIGQVNSLLLSTSVVNGFAAFSSEISVDVTLPYTLSSANYRVMFSTQEPVFLWVSNLTVTGFTINASTAISTPVGYDVFI